MGVQTHTHTCTHTIQFAHSQVCASEALLRPHAERHAWPRERAALRGNEGARVSRGEGQPGQAAQHDLGMVQTGAR